MTTRSLIAHRTLLILATAVGVLFATGVSPAGATNIRVPTDFSTIQPAITAASPGDTVLVADGVYTGAGNKDLTFGGKDIVLVSENGAASTIIDCQNSGRGILFNTGETSAAVVDGFTVQNGSAAGIWITAGPAPTIKNCRILSNQNGSPGGGVRIVSSSSATIINCDITGNEALGTADGGGLYISSSSTLTITDCSITNNTGERGGGLNAASDAVVTMARCQITGNQGTVHGGGLYFSSSSGAVDSCTISGNTAASVGGGLYIGEVSATPTIRDCVITGNTANAGGAVYVTNGASPTFTRCTISGNSVTSDGGALRVTQTGTVVTMDQSILWGNCAGGNFDEVSALSSTAVNFDCSDVDTVGGRVGGGGTVNYDLATIFIDPFFCAPETCGAPTIVGNYAVRACSPALIQGCGPMGALGVGCPEPLTFNVPSPYATIQAAIDATMCDGDTVLVAASGSPYTGLGNKDLDFGGKNIILISEDGAVSTVIDCQGSGRGIIFQNGETNTAVVDGFTITGGSPGGSSGGGIRIDSGSSPVIRNCIIDNCSALPTGVGGGIYMVVGNSSPTIANCTITNNSAARGGGVNAFGALGLATIDSCLIAGNTSSQKGGGIWVGSYGGILITGSIVSGNHAAGRGGGVWMSSYGGVGTFAIMNSSVAGNHADIGGGGVDIDNDFSQVVEIDQSVVWGNSASTGDDEMSISRAAVSVLCSDMDSSGVRIVNGSINYDPDTIFLDPQFCSPQPGASAPTTAGDYTVRQCSSPVLANNNSCGLLMGALGVGCLGLGEYGTAITSVADIPNDQGRRVRVSWNASCADIAIHPTPVVSYDLWRRVDEPAALSMPGSGSRSRSVPLSQPGDWDYVTTVPSRGEASYNVVSETLCDSTTAGVCYASFFVSARTADPDIFFDSDPDSGYSVDNLVPGPPQGAALFVSRLSWEPPEDEQGIDHHSVYGSGVDVLDEAAVLIAATSETAIDVSGSPYPYYHVTATDGSGNEGEAATVRNPSEVDPGVVPAVFALGQNQPNPFQGATRISFDLPETEYVRLRVFSVDGRLVKMLLDGDLGPGRYAIPWQGEDSAGRSLAPGVYFYRLEAGTFRATRRALLLGN